MIRKLLPWLMLLLANPAHAYSVILGWQPSPSPSVTAYNLYEQCGGNGPFALATSVPASSLTATIPGLAENVPCTFYATAADGNGGESGPSNEVTYVALPRLSLDQSMTLSISAVAGNVYALQATSNLQGPWNTIATITAPSDKFTYPIPTDQPVEFFRLMKVSGMGKVTSVKLIPGPSLMARCTPKAAHDAIAELRQSLLEILEGKL